MYSQKIFNHINSLLVELTNKGYKTFSHQLYNEIYFEYKVEDKINGIITGGTSIARVEQLIKDLEELNK